MAKIWSPEPEVSLNPSVLRFLGFQAFIRINCRMLEISRVTNVLSLVSYFGLSVERWMRGRTYRSIFQLSAHQPAYVINHPFIRSSLHLIILWRIDANQIIDAENRDGRFCCELEHFYLRHCWF